MNYSIVGNEDGEANITVFHGGKVLVAHSTHPNFERIQEGVLGGDDSVLDLFDIATAVAKRFDRLSERVTVANGRLYFDGDEVDNALSKQAVRFLNDGVNDWKPLVYFYENVMQNPQEHSREQLYEWLSRRDFTITDDGMIVGYKGVRRVDDETFESISSGTAIVNGEVITGCIPQKLGDVVEMPREQVAFDPAVGCSTGLHVGNYRYASSFAQGAILEVHVNPRDVVSVPTDSDWEKVRVCRYTVVNTIDAEYTTPVRWSEDYQDEYGDEELAECYNCGRQEFETNLYDGLCEDCYDDAERDAWQEDDADSSVWTCDNCNAEMTADHDHGENGSCLCESCFSSEFPTDTDEAQDDDDVSRFEWGY